LWYIILGSLFVFVVLFMPKGILGLFDQLKDLCTRKDKPEPPQTQPEPVAAAKPIATTLPPS